MKRVSAGVPTGGQFAPTVAANDVETPELELSAQNYYLINTAQLKIVGRTATLQKGTDGQWTPARKSNSLAEHSFSAKLNRPLDHTKEEVRDYCVAVICDMLNSNDIPPYPDYFKVAACGVSHAGAMFKGQGAWLQIDQPVYEDVYMTIAAMAQARTLCRLAERVGTNIPDDDSSGKLPHPDTFISNSQIFIPHFYKGEDGGMIDRYAEISFTESGPKILDVSYPDGATKPRWWKRQDPTWLAAYLLGRKDEENQQHHAALTCLEHLASTDTGSLFSLFHQLDYEDEHSDFSPRLNTSVAIFALPTSSPLAEAYFRRQADFLDCDMPQAKEKVRQKLLERVNKLDS